MADHFLPVFGFGTIPDNSGEVSIAPISTYATIGSLLFDANVFMFENSGTKDTVDFSFIVPNNYSSATTDPRFKPYWFCSETNNCVWDIEYRVFGNDDPLDVGTQTEALTATVTQAGVAEDLTISDAAGLDATRTNFSAGDLVLGKISRDTSDAADTITVVVALIALVFKYSDA